MLDQVKKAEASLREYSEYNEELESTQARLNHTVSAMKEQWTQQQQMVIDLEKDAKVKDERINKFEGDASANKLLAEQLLKRVQHLEKENEMQ